MSADLFLPVPVYRFVIESQLALVSASSWE